MRDANKEANVFVAGLDAHTRYVVVSVVNSAGELMLKPTRVRVEQPDRVLALLAPYRPLEVVMETSSSWPWLSEVLSGADVGVVLARMRLAGCIPAVYVTPAALREWATLIRHRTALVRQRTMLVNRLHAQLHTRGLNLERGRLLTRAGRQWLRHEAWA